MRPHHRNDISPEGHLKLLEMSYARLRFSIYMMPLVATPLTAYTAVHQGFFWPLFAWGLIYGLIGAGVYQHYRRRYLEDKITLDSAALYQRYLPLIKCMAGLHGLGLTLCVLLSSQVNITEFNMLLYLVIGFIIAANATHQTPSIRVFWWFFLGSWPLMTLVCYWVFPSSGLIFMMLCVVYSIVIVKHAVTAHRFSVAQIQLKEHSQNLATQFEAAKTRAEQALAEKNQLLLFASHDLRQPIHAMSFLAEAVSILNTDPKLTPLLHDLRQGMATTQAQFNALLDLSRLEAGHIPVNNGPVALAPLLLDMKALFQQQALSQGLSFHLHLPRQEAWVHSDASLLHRSVSNLLQNALRYTHQGGILLALRRRGDAWCIQVWDTGVGVALEDQAQIFSPNYRPVQAWRVDGKGNGQGLGLAVVAQCACMMAAQYGCRSKLHRGSVFWLSLPIYSRAGDAPFLWGSTLAESNHD